MIRILHVDDSPADQEILQIFLKRLNRQLEFENAESVDAAMEHIEEGKYDLIISDFQMPQKDGLQFLRNLRGDGNDIPFIFFTGQGNEEIAANAFLNGADDYYTKETGFALHQRMLNSIIKLVVTHRRLASQSWLEHSYKKIRNRMDVLQSLFDQIPYGLIVFRQTEVDHYELEAANPAVERMLKSSREDLQDAHFHYLFHPKAVPTIVNAAKEARDGAGVVELLGCNFMQDGNDVDRHIQLFPLEDDKICMVVY